MGATAGSSSAPAAAEVIPSSAAADIAAEICGVAPLPVAPPAAPVRPLFPPAVLTSAVSITSLTQQRLTAVGVSSMLDLSAVPTPRRASLLTRKVWAPYCQKAHVSPSMSALGVHLLCQRAGVGTHSACGGSGYTPECFPVISLGSLSAAGGVCRDGICVLTMRSGVCRPPQAPQHVEMRRCQSSTCREGAAACGSHQQAHLVRLRHLAGVLTGQGASLQPRLKMLQC